MGMDLGSEQVKSEINVTPLVDVCLVLLIIFMVVTPLLQKGIAVQLPVVKNPDPQPEGEKNVIIAVQFPDETIHYGDTWIPKDLLVTKLQEDYARSPSKPIFLKGDARLEFGKIKPIMKAVQDTGFKNLGLVAQKAETGQE